MSGGKCLPEECLWPAIRGGQFGPSQSCTSRASCLIYQLGSINFRSSLPVGETESK